MPSSVFASSLAWLHQAVLEFNSSPLSNLRLWMTMAQAQLSTASSKTGFQTAKKFKTLCWCILACRLSSAPRRDSRTKWRCGKNSLSQSPSTSAEIDSLRWNCWFKKWTRNLHILKNQWEKNYTTCSIMKVKLSSQRSSLTIWWRFGLPSLPMTSTTTMN